MTRHVPVIAVAAAILLTAAFWFVLYQPLREEQAGYELETAQLETERSDLEAQLVTLREVEENLEDYQSQLVRLNEYVPDAPLQPAVLRELQRAADDSGVEITELVFGDPEAVLDAPETSDPETVMARIPIQMTVSGAYFQVVDLLRRIEVDMARAVKVDTVTMAEDDEFSFPDLTVTWTGGAYSVLPVSKAAGAEELIQQAAEEASENAESSDAESSDGESSDGDEAQNDDGGDAAEPAESPDAAPAADDPPADTSDAGTS